MEGVRCVGGEGWMWVVGACLCSSVQVFVHVHCVCVFCVLCVLCVLCVCVCVCVLYGMNVCSERGGGVWKE